MLFPDFFLDRIILNSAGFGVNSTLDFFFEDHLNNDSSNWITSDDLLSVLDFNIIQIINDENEFREILFGKEIEENDKVLKKTLPLREIFQKQNASNFLTNDVSNNKLEIPLQQIFRINQKIDDLFYVYYLSVNSGRFSQIYDVEPDLVTDLSFEGHRKGDLVLRNDKIIDQSFILMTGDGQIWSGPVHLVGRTVRTGEIETGDSQTLNLLPVHNYKIHISEC